MNPILSVKDLVKTYDMRATKVNALQGVSLDIFNNEYVALMGPSGSGKSTLMNLLGCLDTPTQGIISTSLEIMAILEEIHLSACGRPFWLPAGCFFGVFFKKNQLRLGPCPGGTGWSAARAMGSRQAAAYRVRQRKCNSCLFFIFA